MEYLTLRFLRDTIIDINYSAFIRDQRLAESQFVKIQIDTTEEIEKWDEKMYRMKKNVK